MSAPAAGSYAIDVVGNCVFEVDVELLDRTMAIYDKEDGVWFNEKYRSYRYEGSVPFSSTVELELDKEELVLDVAKVVETNVVVDDDFEIKDEF